MQNTHFVVQRGALLALLVVASLCQSKHVSRFRRCWPAHKIPLNLSEDELEDFQMLPRLPMCYWDFEAEQMVVASMVAPEGGGKRSGSGNGKKSGAHFFYCVDPDLSIAELEEQARKDEDDYATQVCPKFRMLVHSCACASDSVFAHAETVLIALAAISLGSCIQATHLRFLLFCVLFWWRACMPRLCLPTVA